MSRSSKAIVLSILAACGDDAPSTNPPDGVAADASLEPVACTVAAAQGPAPLPALPATLGACGTHGWCFENPTPYVGEIGVVWHRPEVTYLTTGETVFRYRNGAWDQLPPMPRPPGNADVMNHHDIWATGDVLYISGALNIAGIVWKWDGASWSFHEFENANPFHIWGTSAERVMVNGNGGAYLYDNGTWSKTEIPRMLGTGQGAWGCKDTFFGGFFAGSFMGNEMVIGRHGAGWTETAAVPTPNTQLAAISGVANDDVFAGGFINGGGASMWHFDGNAWTDIAAPDMRGILDVAAIGPNQAIAAGASTDGMNGAWRYDGTQWTGLGLLGDGDLSVAAPDNILIAQGLRLSQFDGTQWAEPFALPNANPLNSKSFVGVWAGATTSFAITSDRIVATRSAQGWVAMTTPVDAMGRQLRAIWGTSEQDIFVVGDRGLVLHYDGTQWTASTAGNGLDDLTALWGTAPNNVYAAADFKILHYDGTAWTSVATGSNIVGISGTSATDVWGLNASGTIFHFDGTTWTSDLRIPEFPSGLRAIYAASPTRVFVVGQRGQIFAYDGATWTSQPQATIDLTAVWGRSASDVFAIGQSGHVFHYDGTAWTNIKPAYPYTLGGISGTASKTIIVGDLGAILSRP